MLADHETGDARSNTSEEQFGENSGKELKRTKRIAVIGAGFSGLTAAAELKRLGECAAENTS